jgi:adenosine deaminase
MVWFSLHITNNITSKYMSKSNLCSIHGLHNINAHYNNISFMNFQCVFVSISSLLMTMPLFTCFYWSRTVMHTDFLIYQCARNIIRSGLCNIILHADIEYKRNNDLFYSLNVYKKRVIYHCANIIKNINIKIGINYINITIELTLIHSCEIMQTRWHLLNI